MRRGYRIAIFVLLAIALVVVVFWPWFSKQIAIDKCLDAGGRWEYSQAKCEGAKADS
jgi:hypothetical protein